jgi:hypothetical protein
VIIMHPVSVNSRYFRVWHIAQSGAHVLPLARC